MNRFVSFLPPVVVVASCAVTSPTDALDSAGFIVAFPGASHLQYEYVNGPTEQASEFATVYALRAEERLQRATAESRERDAAHALATRKLQLSPRIGDRAALGTIIDLRPPLALVQYDERYRILSNRPAAEWLRIDGLSAASGGL